MKQIQRQFGFFLLGLVLTFTHVCSAKTALRAGAAKVDISPTSFPVIRNGGFLEARDDRVADPIHARALVLESGSNRVAMVVVDSCMIPRSLCDQIKDQAATGLGLRHDRILISATHTHTAPSVMNYCLGTSADPTYTALLPGKIVEALAKATGRLQPAQVGWTRVDAGAFTFCRRWILRSDRVREDPFGNFTVRANMHPGHEHPDFIGPSGPKDPWLSLLSLQTIDGKPLALLANFSMHYFGGHPGISSDYCGRFSEGLATRLAPADPDFVGIMSQGTSGDLMWMDYGRPRESWNVDDYSGHLLDLAEAAAQRIVYRADIDVAMAERRLTLPRRLPNAERLQWAKKILAEMGDQRPRNQQEVYAEQAMYIHEHPEEEIVLQAVRLGELGITALPNEVYGITGLKIKARSPLPAVFNIELANGAAGYIPPPEQHALGGYTTWPARTAGLATEAEPEMVETVLALLEDVSGKSRRDGREPASAYSRVVRDSKPIAFWRLGEFEGERAEDWSGNQNHGRFEGRVAYHLPGVESSQSDPSTLYDSHAVQLAGGHVAGTISSLRGTFTAEFWFWNGLPNEAREVTATLFARGNEELILTGQSDARPGRLQLGDQRGSTQLATKHWHHVALVQDERSFRVYLNGNHQPELEGSKAEATSQTTTVLIGDARDHLSPLEGRVDEVAIYDRALFPAELVSHFQAAGVSLPPVVNPPQPPSTTRIKPFASADSDRYAKAVQSSRPLAYWPLHGSAEGMAKDQGRLGFPGTFEGKAGLRSAGSEVPNFHDGRMVAPPLSLKDTYSVELWFRNELSDRARPVTGYLFSRGVDSDPEAAGDHLGIGGTHSSTGRLFLFNGNALYHERAGHTVIPTGTWNQVVFVREGLKVTAYLNGEITPEIQGTLQPTYPAEPCPVFIGGRNDRFAPFQGMIDQVSIYARALSPSEVETHFQASGVTKPSAPAELAMDAQDDLRPLSPSESMRRTHVADGFVLELVAAEPMVRDPVAIDWGPDGSLWVAEMADYPYGMDGRGQSGGRIRRLTDTDGDGRYDQFSLFLDQVNFPTSVMAWRQGVLVTAAPDLFYAEDTDGDGRADRRDVLFTGFMQGNQQLRVNSLRWGLDNWVYAASGGHHAGFGKATQISVPSSGEEFELGSRDFRFRPERLILEPRSGPSQYGRIRDDWGNWFGVQNSFPLWHYVVDDRYLSRNPDVAAPDSRRQLRLPPNPRVYPKTAQKRFHSFEQSGRFTSACGPSIYRDDFLFAPGDKMHAFTCEPFHNVVQHHLLTRDGISFRGERAESESELDFYASADRWSRPVMTRTGPDGALWIVDMYRYMIEHPDWLPQEGRDELKPRYRSGENYGRIYRVYPAGQKPRPIPILTNLTTVQLVETLASQNGHTRDLAHRLLLEKGDKAAVPPLEAMVRSEKDPRARLQALRALDGLGALSKAILLRSFADGHFALRRHALQLMETRGDDDPELRRAALNLAQDGDEQVRLQLVCLVGEWEDAEAGRALVELAKTAPDDSLFQSAVLSSAKLHYETLAGALAKDERYGKALMTMALANHARLAMWLDKILPRSGDDLDLQVRAMKRVGTWLSVMEERRRPLGAFLESDDPRLAPVIPRVEELLAQARTTVASGEGSEERRQSALALLGWQPELRASDLAMMGPLLDPRTERDLQRAAMHHVARMNVDSATDALLAHWSKFSPDVRVALTTELLGRVDQAMRLLHAVEAGTVAAVDIGPSHRQQLLKHPNDKISSAAQALFQGSTDAELEALLTTYRPALAMEGKPERGFQLFKDRCSVCHVLRETGTAIGPDLRSVTDLTGENLLVAIVDPSRNVEPKYLGYTATLINGEAVHGLIQSETGNSLIMVLLDGSRRELLRADIQSLSSSRLSFMPNGLTAGISAQEMADLMAFVREATRTDR